MLKNTEWKNKIYTVCNCKSRWDLERKVKVAEIEEGCIMKFSCASSVHRREKKGGRERDG